MVGRAGAGIVGCNCNDSEQYVVSKAKKKHKLHLECRKETKPRSRSEHI